MPDGGPKRTVPGGFGIHMDPLVIAGGIGKPVDPFLVDRQPAGGAEGRADGAGEVCDRVDLLHTAESVTEVGGPQIRT